MPAIITHYAYCLEAMENKESKYKNAIILGSQGPDTFFFFGQIPWNRRGEHRLDVNEYGTKLHHMDITEVYNELIKYAYASDDKELLFAFIEGLFIHYSLDRNCHPYIFARSGFTAKEEEKKSWALSHMWYETLLDSTIAKIKGVSINRPARYLKIDNESLKKISIMWNEVNKVTKVSDYIDENSFYASAKDYQGVMGITNVPKHLSYAFTKLVMGKNSQAHRMNIPHNIPKKYQGIDFLNENRDEWPNIVTGEMRNESFMELWDKALQDIKIGQALLNRAKNGEDIKEELRAYINNIDHDGIAPEDVMRYRSVVWNWPE